MGNRSPTRLLIPVGHLALLGVLLWWSDLPLKPWWGSFLGLATLVILGHGIVLEWRTRRWSDQTAALLRGGFVEVPPPPRGSLAVLGVYLALALAGSGFLALSLFRRLS